MPRAGGWGRARRGLRGASHGGRRGRRGGEHPTVLAGVRRARTAARRRSRRSRSPGSPPGAMSCTRQGLAPSSSRCACPRCGASWPRSAPTPWSRTCAARRSSTSAHRRCQTASSRRCSPARICVRRSGSVTGAILELLARARLPRSELAHLTLTDVQARGRQPDPRRRAALAARRAAQTRLEDVVRGAKRARTRTVPLHAQAHDALRRWYTARPAASTDALFVSLRTRHSAVPEPLSASGVGNIVAKHATTAGVREDRRTAPRCATRSARCSPSAASRLRSSERSPATSTSAPSRSTSTSPTNARPMASARSSALGTRWRREMILERYVGGFWVAFVTRALRLQATRRRPASLREMSTATRGWGTAQPSRDVHDAGAR